MKHLALIPLLLVACAHSVEVRDLEARIAALERQQLAPLPVAEPPYHSLRAPSGIFLANMPMEAVNPAPSLLAQWNPNNCTGPSAACSAASFTTTGASTADHFVTTLNGTGTKTFYSSGFPTTAVGFDGDNINFFTSNALRFQVGSTGVLQLGADNVESIGNAGTRLSAIYSHLFDVSAANGSNLISLADSTNAKTLKLRNNNDALELYNNANALAIKLAASGTIGGTITGGTSLASLALNDSVGSQLNYNGYTLVCSTGQCGTGGSTPLAISLSPGTAGSGTGFTMNATGFVVHEVHKITVSRTALTAAATTQDITVWTVPAKTRVLREIADVTAGFDDAAGPISAVTMTCGTTAGGNQYLNSGSVFTTTTLGDVAAEIGAGLLSATVADIPSFSTTTAVQCRFTSTGGNLSTLTTGSVTYYLELLVYP